MTSLKTFGTVFIEPKNTKGISMQFSAQTQAAKFIDSCGKRNDIVEDNFSIGSESVRAFKKIIKQVLYPDWGEKLGASIAQDTINAYIDMDGTQEGILELLVYSCECSVYHLSDTYDVEEDEYKLVQELCQYTVKHLSESNNKLVKEFQPRLRELFVFTQYCDAYGFADGMKAIWLEAFDEVITVSKTQID